MVRNNNEKDCPSGTLDHYPNLVAAIQGTKVVRVLFEFKVGFAPYCGTARVIDESRDGLRRPQPTQPALKFGESHRNVCYVVVSDGCADAVRTATSFSFWRPSKCFSELPQVRVLDPEV